MASTNRITLTNAVGITGNGATTSDAVQVDSRHNDIVAVITVTSFTDGTYDTVIEQSYDGVTWGQVVLATIPQANAAEVQTIAFPNTGRLLYIRAITTAAAVTTGATVTVDLFTVYSARRR